MKNSFNSGNELWTEIAASAGFIGDIAGADCLSTLEQNQLEAIKSFGVSNSYWRPWMKNYVVKSFKKILEMFPGTSD